MGPSGRAFWRYLLAAAVVTVHAIHAPTEWPRDENSTLFPCPHTSVIYDVANGWPAKCLGLSGPTDGGPGQNETFIVYTHTPDSCRKLCEEDSACGVWQLTEESRCYLGVTGYQGHACVGRRGDNYTSLAGQRVMHGDVRVVRALSSEWVPGLYNIGIYDVTNGVTDQERCKQACYSDVTCRYWQYGFKGCWVERAPGYVVTPFTVIANSTAPTDQSKTLVAGEILVHICIPHPQDEAARVMSTETVVIIVVVIGLAAVVGGVGGFKFLHEGGQEDEREKKTRAVKVDDQEEENGHSKDVEDVPEKEKTPLLDGHESDAPPPRTFC